MAEKDRPILITLVGVLYLLVAILFLIMGMILIFLGEDLELEGIGTVAGAVGIIIGIIYLVVSIGLFKGWKPWWYLGIIFAVIGVITGILTFFSGGFIPLIVDLIILWYLFRPKVKSFFLD